jgi:hypothetical protein
VNAFVVIWDGRRDGPGGAQLWVPEEPRPQAAPLPPARGTRDALQQRILAALERTPATNRDLCGMLHAPIEAVNYGLQMLYRHGALEKRGQVRRPPRSPGRQMTVWAVRHHG